MPFQTKPSPYMTKHYYNYGGHTIPYAIWSNAATGQLKTIVFLGTVQIDEIPKWVIEACPPNTAVVQGAPHWFAKRDGSDIPAYVFGFTKAAFEALLANYSFHKVHVIAESQGAPGAIELFMQNRQYPPYLQKLTLLQPLGLNAAAFVGSDQKRLRTFRQRVAANALHQLKALILDKRLRYNHRLMIRTVNMDSERANAQYNSGLKYDGGPSLAKLYAVNKNIAVVCGANDKLFVPAEIRDTLMHHQLNIQVRAIEGIPHSPLATQYGQKILREALKTTKNESPSHHRR